MDVTVRTMVARERSEVAGFAMHPANETRWIGGIRSVRVLTPPPVGIGTRVERIAAFLGRQFRYVLEVDSYEPGREVVMRSVEAPFPMRVTYAFADAAGGTLVTNRVEGDPEVFYRFAGPLMRWMVRASLTRDLRTLKRQLEGAAVAR